MIWHLVEVWILVVLTFVVGCLAGAHLYGVIADSRLAVAQGIVADAVGDVLDRVKARLGLAPAWRPVHLRHVERVWPDEPDVAVESLPEIETPAGDVAATTTMYSGDDTEIAADRTPRTRRKRDPSPALSPRQATLPPPPVVTAVAPIAPPKRPPGLAAPRGGVPDNLQKIKGIGKRNEELLNRLGIYHFGQIAAWTPSEIRWIGQYLVFPERITRDDWLSQATLLAMGAETGFQKSAERRRERRRRERAFEARMATASAAYDEDPDQEASFEPETDDAALGSEDYDRLTGGAADDDASPIDNIDGDTPDNDGAEVGLPSPEEAVDEERSSAPDDEGSDISR